MASPLCYFSLNIFAYLVILLFSEVIFVVYYIGSVFKMARSMSNFLATMKKVYMMSVRNLHWGSVFIMYSTRAIIHRFFYTSGTYLCVCVCFFYLSNCIIIVCCTFQFPQEASTTLETYIKSTTRCMGLAWRRYVGLQNNYLKIIITIIIIITIVIIIVITSVIHSM